MGVSRRPAAASRSPQPSRSFRIRLLLALAVTALAASWIASPVRAQTTSSPADARPRVRLLSQTPWVGPTGTFSMRLALPGAPPGASISVTLYDDVSKGGRFHYLDTLRGSALGSPLHAPY